MRTAKRKSDDPRRMEYMKRALSLARRGRGSVEPNPMVGCVIVKRGRVIGEGWHRRFGGPHAEINALQRCSQDPAGATVYVTLEPCNHYGKTPPCVDALIEAKVKRVIVAIRDPFEQVSGKGIARLRRAGIEVEVGLLEDQAAELNRPFLTVHQKKRAYVIAKWAQSIDGKIATRTGDSQWISGEESRRLVHRLRSGVDGIMVGVGTVLKDDPQLTCRLARPKRIATRIVVDSQLRIPHGTILVQTAREIPTLIATTKRAPRAKSNRLQRAGVDVITCRTRNARVDLGDLFKKLAQLGMTNVLVEGGGQLLGTLHDQNLIDEAYVFTAPILIGGKGVSALGGRGLERVNEAPRLQLLTQKRIGQDWLLHWKCR